MYKLVLKDNTVINLKSLDEDTEKFMLIKLDTQLSHDAVISKFTEDNLQYVQVLHDDVVLNTYVNIKEVAKSSVENGVITVKLSKSDTKEIVINLRKENKDLKETVESINNSINELYDVVIASTMQKV